MKHLALLSAILFPTVALADDVNVSGYYRKNGTYVEPHTRSTPNAYKWDNKSYEPSQPAYNDSYSKPTKNYSDDYYKPSSTRYLDNNPNNDTQPAYNGYQYKNYR